VRLAAPPRRVDDARVSDTTVDGPTTPARPDVRARLAGSWAGVAAALLFGLLTDAVVRGRPGLGLTVATWFAVSALVLLARPRPAAWPFLAAAATLGTFFTLRESAVLLTLDLLGVAALLCVAATFATAGTPAASTVRSYLARSVFEPLAAVPDGLHSLTGPPARELSGKASARAIARAAIVIVPVAAFLTVLLGSADPVFRRFVHTPSVDPSVWPPHLAAIAVGAVALATLAAMGLRDPSGAVDAATRPVHAGWARTVEWAGLLAVVDVLFAVFVAIQFTVFFGGRTHVLADEGLTYAQYARGGFWQLLGATAIAGSVLGFGWLALPHPAPERTRRLYRVLSWILLALLGVVLVSAFRRLALYEEAYGLTWLRVLVHTTIVALGALFVGVAIALALWRASWLPTAAGAIITVSVLALNVANLDARIASANLARAQAGHPLDPVTLRALSADAAGPIAASLPSLDRRDRAVATFVLACVLPDRLGDEGWASFNLARSRAGDVLDRLELPACSYPFG
jgi:Domain of unknown function (DUF4153)